MVAPSNGGGNVAPTSKSACCNWATLAVKAHWMASEVCSSLAIVQSGHWPHQGCPHSAGQDQVPLG